MNIYDAIMKAAAHIGSAPDEFNVNEIRTPAKAGCGSPACALGWITHFMGFEESHQGYSRALAPMGNIGSHEFYVRMAEVNGEEYNAKDWNVWAKSGRACANALRLYAAKYHAPAKVVQPPDWNAITLQTVGEHERSQEIA